MTEKRKIYLLNSVVFIVLLGLTFFIFYTIFHIRNQAIQNEKQRLEKQVALIGRQIEHTWRRFENEIAYNNSTGFHEKLLIEEKLSDYDKNKVKKFYARYQNLIKKIEIYDSTHHRIIKKDTKNYYNISGRIKNKFKRHLNREKFVLWHKHNSNNFCLPIYDKQGRIIGNFEIILDFQKCIRNILSDYYIGRESWEWIVKENEVLDIAYTEGSVDESGITISALDSIINNINNNYKNIISHSLIKEDREIKVLSAFYPVNISSERIGIVISSTYDVVIGKIQNRVYHIIAVIVLIGLFLSVLFFRMYRKVRNSEATFRGIIENMEDTYFRVDMEGELQMLSPSGYKLFGYEEGELIGEKIQTLLYYNSQDWDKFLKEMDKRGKVESYELVLKDSRDLPVYVIVSSRYIHNNTNNPVGIEGVISDITLRKKTEEELEEKTMLLSNLLDSIPNMIYFKNMEGRYLGCNDAFQKLTGFNKEEIVGCTDHEILPENMADKISKYDKVVLDKKKQINLQAWFQYPENSRALLNILKAPLTTSDGITIGLLGIGQDITEQEKARRELKEARDKAEESNRLKSEFLANMSHEIRTPMNSVIGYSELLADEVKSDLGKKYIESLQSAGESLIELIDDILDLSKIEAGKMEIEYSYVNISSLLQYILNIFKPKAESKNLELKTEIDNNLPEEIFIDNHRLKQILFNLIGNAVKFTEEGEVKIVAKELRKDKKTVDIKFSVQDTGIGIPEETQEIIFNSFTQKEGHDKRKFGGTGLGLTISKKLVSMMNGKIEVESEPCQGSKFDVKFEKVRYKEQNHKQARENVEIDLNFDSASIMVVDDNDLNREVLSETLKKKGAEVTTLDNGKAAIEKAEQGNFDIIFMDIKMPKIDGVEASKQIKEINSNIPIVATTAGSDQEMEKKYINTIFDDIIHKPFQKNQIKKILKKYLENK